LKNTKQLWVLLKSLNCKVFICQFLIVFMKKSVIIVLLLGLLFILPLIQAQTYSGTNRLTDNVKLAFSGGDNKVQVALEIREKEIDSAIINSQNQNEKDAIKNLEKAHKKLQVVNDKISLENAEDVKASVDEVVNKIENEENLSENFDVYVLEEKITQLTAELTLETYKYCKELANGDFALMLQEERCNPETAPESLKKELEDLKDVQIKLFVQLMLEIRSCIDDPGTCNCEANLDVDEKAKCEKMVALAIKCEYKEDETSCNELKAMDALKPESFVPEFLMNLFRAKEEQMLWGTEPSDCVPEECWDYNDKPECRQYDKFKETKEDWDEYGNFIGTKNKCGKEGSIPTMRESIPQCFDGDVFLEEKCGNITMVENEDGLINYIIENEVNGIIEDFENKSAQHTYAPGTTANGSVGYAPGTTANGSLGQAVWVIEGNITDVKNDIETWVVDHPAMSVDGDDGLTWDIKVDVAGTSSGGSGSSGNNVIDDGMCEEGEENCNNDMAPGPQGIVGNQGDGSSGGDSGNNVVDNVVAGGGNGGDSGNNVVDEGPGELGVVDE